MPYSVYIHMQNGNCVSWEEETQQDAESIMENINKAFTTKAVTLVVTQKASNEKEYLVCDQIIKFYFNKTKDSPQAEQQTKHIITVITVGGYSYEIEMESEEAALKACDHYVDTILQEKLALKFTNTINSSQTIIITKHVIAIDYRQETSNV